MIQMNLRIEKKDLELLTKICKARGEGVSDFVRRAIRKELAKLGYLTKEEMKALEVNSV
jgi:uncharacterized protein (DUF1778 family)